MATARSSADRVQASLCAARDGSFTALGRLLDHYRGYLLHLANQELTGNLAAKVAASDLVQETFLHAARGFPRFDGQTEAELKAWLRRILENLLVDAQRRLQRECQQCIPLAVATGSESWLPVRLAVDDGTLPEDAALRIEKQALVVTALAALPELYRRAIELRHFEGKSFEALGQALGRSPDAARQLWRRSIERFAREIARRQPPSRS